MSLFAAIHAPTAAGPLLGLALAKVARTPTPRLAVGYRLLAPCRPCPCQAHLLVREAAAGKRPATPLPMARPLGANLLLDRLLAGGHVGDTLPLANRRLDCEREAVGRHLDLLA